MLTTYQKNYIKKHRFTTTGADMARALGLEKTKVTKYMRYNGLALSPDEQKRLRIEAFRKKIRTTSTPEIDAIIREHYLTIPVKTLAKKIGKSYCFLEIRLRQLGLVIPQSIRDQRKIDSRIKKGSTPPNKGKKLSPEHREKLLRTAFKKGNIPHNTIQIPGTIIPKKDKFGKLYLWYNLGINQWVQYHRYVWEQHNGPVPKGMIFWFKDGNSLNCDINNLELITRQQQVRRNRASFLALPPELQQTKNLINKINKKIQKCETK